MERHAPVPDAPAADAPPSPATAAAAAQSAETAQKPSRGQKRFDELTAQREAAKREADDAKREAAELRARLEAAEQARHTPPPPTAQTPPAPRRPKPLEEQVGTTYPTYGDYIEDLADWKAEQRLAAVDFDARIRDSIEADRASRSFRDQVRDAFAAGPKVYADFDAMLQRSRVQFSPAQQLAIIQTPGAEHVLYALAKDDALAQRVAASDPIRFGFELARLVPASGVASPASTPQTGTSVAPPPYQPVGSGTQTTVVPSASLIQGFDFDKSGYRERRAAERGVRRRR